jgi:hypothetical protein
MIRIIKTMGLCMLLITALSSITKLYAQEKQVTGTVTSSENKQPITGVTVLVKGTRTATTSDAQGHYKIAVILGQLHWYFPVLHLFRRKPQLLTNQ